MRALASSCVPLALALLSAPLGACERPSETDAPDRHHYDDKLAALASFEEPERDAWAKPARVVEALTIETRMHIADLGAGSGYFTRRLATAAPDGTTYAVDVDADFKSHIQDHRELWNTPNIVTRLAVYEHPLLPSESVDLVFISNTYSYLSDRKDYFAKVHMALRPEGRLAVIDWRADARCPRSLGCPKLGERISAETALAELEEVGFRLLEQYEFLDYQYFMVLGRAADASEPTEPAEPTAPTESTAPAEPAAPAEPIPNAEPATDAPLPGSVSETP